MKVKNNSYMLVILFVTMVFQGACIFAVGEARQIKYLYGELLRIQGIDSPQNAMGRFKCGHESEINATVYKKSAAEAFYGTQSLFKTMFEQAGQTGLIAQYRQLILSDNPQFLMMFCDKLHLQMVAYMQNVYGKGNAFAYDTAAKPVILIGGSNYPYESPVIGNYVNPNRQNLIMTRYSVLNGIIDQLVALEQDQTASRSKEYQNFCNVLLVGLTEAIRLSCREKLYLLENNIGCSYAIDPNFMGKINHLIGGINTMRDLLFR